MIDIQLEGLDRIEKRLEAMQDRIRHAKSVDIGAELSTWQTEDLHRDRPFTMRSRAKGKATTVVRPHSLYEVKHSARYQHADAMYAVRLAKRLAKAKRPLRVVRHFEPKTSTRPYLRPEMRERLIERLHEMVREKIKW